jgi:hypothetical protein
MSAGLKLTAWLAAPCLLLGASGAFAAGPTPAYTYGELGYISTDLGDSKIDGDGFGIGGSWAIDQNVHMVFRYQGLDLSQRADGSVWNLGAGVNFPIRPGLDAVGRISYVHGSAEVPGSPEHNQGGYAFEGLVRVMINPQLEINGGIEYVNLDASDTSGQIGAVYEIAKNVAITAELGISGDAVSFFIGGRVYFRPPFMLHR